MTKRKASVALDNGNESNQSSSTQDNNSNSTSTTNTTTGTNNNNNQNSQNGTNTIAIVMNPNTSNRDDTQQQQQQQQQQLAGNVVQNNNNNNNNQQQQKNKKERADNWSSAEIQVLHRGIESRRDIFYGPPSQATKKNRELAWDAITKEVNSVSTTPRSLSQVMKKFKNEKCRAKRKFTIDNDKDGHNNNNNTNNNNNNNNNSNLNNNNNNNNNTNQLSAQNHLNNNQQLQQPQQQPQTHHMTTNETISSQPSSINVVKLAPQNVAKTMIDLPGHVQHIQMPNDDMVLIVQPEMDGLMSGMNIVSDANSHHFQKCSNTLNNQQNNHHGHHTIQAINSGQAGLVSGTMSNGMMARTIPAGSMCSLVYSTGNEVCGPDPHLGGTLTSGPNPLATNHIGINGQAGLMHHRGSVEQNQGQQQQQQLQQQQHPQQQQQQQQPQHHHQMHPPPPQQLQSQPQQQPQTQQHIQTHQAHQQAQHHQNPHLQQNHMATTTSTTISSNNGISHIGVAAESQLKNLLFNLLFKDGQHTLSNNQMNGNGNSSNLSGGGVITSHISSANDYNKQRNDMLVVIANSLNKIENHLCKLTKVVGSIYGQNINQIGSNDNDGNISNLNSNNQNNGLNLNNNDGNNNSLTITGNGNQIGSQTGSEPQ